MCVQKIMHRLERATKLYMQSSLDFEANLTSVAKLYHIWYSRVGKFNAMSQNVGERKASNNDASTSQL